MTQVTRFAGLAAVLALVIAVGAAAAYWGTGGRLSYTEPAANPSISADITLIPPSQRRAPEPFGFADAQGGPLTLADFRGRVVLVNLWATWCPPCVAEMPSLDALQTRLGGGRFHVVAISLDRGGTEVAARWFQRNRIAALTLYAGNAAQFGNALLPTSYLIDAEGRVAWTGIGMQEWDGPQAGKVIAQLMEEGRSGTPGR